MKRVERLTARHLDGLLSPEERAELDRLLVADREAARTFVEMARMENALELHFRAARAEDAVGSVAAPAEAKTAAPLFPPSRLGRFVDHIWGPSAAVLLHAALLLLLLRWAFLPPSPVPAAPSVTMRPDRRVELDPRVPAAPVEPGVDALPPLLSLQPSDPEPWSGLALQPAARLVPRPPDTARTDALRPAWPEWYAQRSLSARRRRLAWLGRTEADYFEQTVEDVLAELAQRQRPDGGWGATNPAGAEPTALAVLAFLSRGHVPGSPLYGDTVESALRRLVATPDPEDRDGAAVRLLALAEAYAISRIPALPGAVRAGAERLLAEQRPDGGWDGPGGAAEDALRIAWRVHALVTARAAGLAPDGTGEALAHAAGYVKTRHDPARPVREASSAPDAGGAARALRTAAAWRTLQLLGEERSPEARRCEALLHRLVRGMDEERWDLPLLHELALVLAGGGEPEPAQQATARALLWRAAEWARMEATTQAPSEWPRTAALAALTLGAPYRYASPAPQHLAAGVWDRNSGGACRTPACAGFGVRVSGFRIAQRAVDPQDPS